jgi:hypothetical protein
MTFHGTLRPNTKFLNRINLILPVQTASEKYSASLLTQIISSSRRPVSHEGRWPSSRTLGRDAVDAAASGGQV